MKLSQIANRINCEEINFVDTDITDIVIDSRKVTKGSLFVCIDGFSIDGHEYAEAAITNGASAIICERKLDGINVPQLLVEKSRKAFALTSSLWYGDPAKDLKVIGITGTNGKTSTAHMLRSIFEANGIPVATLGTIGTYINGEVLSQSLTTPDPMDLHKIFGIARDKGCKVAVMEVSAHALALYKVAGVEFEACAFTNLSQDHLDDFGTMENYRQAKAKMFNENCQHAVINIDDSSSDEMVANFNGTVIPVSLDKKDGYYACDIKKSLDGLQYSLWDKDGKYLDVNLKVPGLPFNIYNSMTAILLAKAVGLSDKELIKGTKNIENIDGRMQVVDIKADFKAIVDYAHTPDSMQRVLENVREFCENKLICVFGCGGNRDTKKRPMMGKIAGEYADFSVVTSDNPRTEDPYKIIEQIEEGISTLTKEYIVIENRREAIQKAIDLAGQGDIIAIVGKGHETYQDVMGVKHHFDDREVVREYMDKED